MGGEVSGRAEREGDSGTERTRSLNANVRPSPSSHPSSHPSTPAHAAGAATAAGRPAATLGAAAATEVPKPFVNPRAAAASAAQAATFPQPTLPGTQRPGERLGRGGGGGGGAGAGAGAGGRGGAGGQGSGALSEAEAVDVLTELGARVLFPDELSSHLQLGWDALAASSEMRDQIEEALLWPMSHPEAFAEVQRGTRALPASAVRPTAMLFYGPPGTGKTTAARIAAAEAKLPLVFAPLEALVSKWYGQGEQRLAALFDGAAALGPAVLMLDELDALAGSRSRELHEASRRMLSVLLRRLDGLEANPHTALVAATNRPQDLDSALLSRFDVRVAFPPPDAECRASILALYAKHLPDDALTQLANASEGLSGRDIFDACRLAERKWVCMRLRGRVTQPALPPPDEYARALESRRALALHVAKGRDGTDGLTTDAA